MQQNNLTTQASMLKRNATIVLKSNSSLLLISEPTYCVIRRTGLARGRYLALAWLDITYVSCFFAPIPCHHCLYSDQPPCVESQEELEEKQIFSNFILLPLNSRHFTQTRFFFKSNMRNLMPQYLTMYHAIQT